MDERCCSWHQHIMILLTVFEVFCFFLQESSLQQYCRCNTCAACGMLQPANLVSQEWDFFSIMCQKPDHWSVLLFFPEFEKYFFYICWSTWRLICWSPEISHTTICQAQYQLHKTSQGSQQAGERFSTFLSNSSKFTSCCQCEKLAGLILEILLANLRY